MSAKTTDHSSMQSNWLPSILAALIATIIIYALALINYTDTGIPNADNTMRLITLRDLLAGQNWLDPVQYRLGLDAGTLMHWSRLVDAPIWGLYQLGLMVTDSSKSAEAFVKVAWPAVTLFIALLSVNIACNRLGQAQMRMPTTVIATVCFMTIGVFSPGALDHHNIQVALSVLLIALLLPGQNEARAHMGAGIVAVLMLAIGMETLPYVTIAGAWVALAFLVGIIAPKTVRVFGISFALCALFILVLTVAPSAYFLAYCDAYSIFHLAMCGVGGLGLGAASMFANSLRSRLAGLIGTAIIVAAVLVVWFPKCLSNPLSSLDPKLIKFWLDGVVETRSLPDLWLTDPYALFGMFGMAITGLVAAIFIAYKQSNALRYFGLLSAVLLVVAIGVTAWQQRGSMFAASFAILPLAFIVTKLRAQYLQTQSITALIKMACVGILSLNMFWWIAGANAAKYFSDAPTLQEQAAAASPRDYCYTEDVYETLAVEPKGVVLGATDIGASVLKFTHHRAMAGPYHRNTDGNLAMIEIMLASPLDAKEMLKKSGVTLIADCINSVDAKDFKKAQPNGLQAALHKGEVPDYLERIDSTLDTPMVLYRIKK